jgi:Na+/H+-dicarboxylate symporter
MSAASPPPLPSNAGNKLTVRILFGMAAGILLGLALNWFVATTGGAWIHAWFSNGILHVLGQAFVRLLQVIVVPLVFVSLVCGTAALEDIVKVGRIGAKTLALYLFTTALAITFAMVAALIVKPGAGFPLEGEPDFDVSAAPSLVEVVIGLFPVNIVKAMAEGQMLPIIVFAVLFGLALSTSGEAGKRLLGFFDSVNTVVMRLVWLIMQLAPIGVFALITRTFATQGFEAFVPLLKYFFLVLAVLLFHGLVTYPALLTVLGRLHPGRFLRKMREVQVFAFSTASSNATLPISLRVCEEKLGVRNSVASFTIPLGATINMDGTAIMQGVATVFIAQVYGVDLSVGQLLMVVLTATLASIGTAGVPGVGLIMLAMVLQQVGLPVAGIGLIIGIDRLLDMVRTAVNVTGDCAVSCLVAKSEGEWDEAVFNESTED